METVVGYILTGLFGASIGSFVTMLVYRMPENKVIGHSRSYCPNCKHELQYFELIPIVSFLFLRGRCRYCHSKISIQYLLIEIAIMVLYMYAWLNFIHSGNHSVFILIRDWLVVFVMVFTFAYDLLYLEVSPVITIGGGIIAAVLYLWGVPHEWISILIGILIGVLWFGAQYVVSKGRWIGGGDSMIGFCMGAALGFPNIIAALGIAYVLGAAWALMLMIIWKKNRKDQIAFGTFLSIGTLMVLWWGDSIISWYQSFLY